MLCFQGYQNGIKLWFRSDICYIKIYDCSSESSVYFQMPCRTCEEHNKYFTSAFWGFPKSISLSLNCLFQPPPFSKSHLYCHRNIFPYSTICNWAEESVSLSTVFLQQVHRLHISNVVFLAYQRNQYLVVRLPKMTCDMCLHTCKEHRETAAGGGT